MEKQKIYDAIRDLNMQDEALLAIMLHKLKEAIARKSKIETIPIEMTPPSLVREVTKRFIDDFSDLLIERMSKRN